MSILKKMVADSISTIFIVTPCRNAADTIVRTLTSVLTQAGDFYLRYHVQDGESNDGTLDILRNWKHLIDGGVFPIQCRGVEFSYESRPDKGMYDAIVMGISQLKAGSSNFMTWINADDLLMPGALSLVGKVASDFPDEQVSWLGGQPMIVRNDMPIARVDRSLPTVVIGGGLCDGKIWDFVQQEGTFFRRWLWDAADPSSNFASYRLAGDWNLWRLFAQHADYVQTQWPLGSFRLRDGQLSQVNANAYMAEIDATIPRQNRIDALHRLVETGKITRMILKARYPEGKLFLVEESANGPAQHFYQKAFGQRPGFPLDVNTERSTRVICEECQIEHRVATTLDIERERPVTPPPYPERFDSYTYAKKSHWQYFAGLDVELFGEQKSLELEQLKVYQDLLVLRFIRDNIPLGARILDVGGGNSRILNHLHRTYECWNIDKLEGLGNGPRALNDPPYRLVRDYMGNFNSELPDNYFDLVFSISALEHVPQGDTSLFDKILADIDRVLKPGGLSLHLFDIVLKPNAFWTNRFTQHIFGAVRTLNRPATPDEMRADEDFFAMSETAYNNTWLHTVKKAYADHGWPSSLNILWKKTVPRSEGISDRSMRLPVFVSVPTHWQSRRFFVATPCLNVVATIDRTIQSVLSQSVQVPIHFHVQDGGSTDGTIERLQQWELVISRADAYRNVTFTWKSSPDSGMYDALSRAFDSMDAQPNEFLTWINGDDILMSDAIETVLRIADIVDDVKWIGGAIRVIDEHDQVVEEHDLPTPRELIAAGLCDGDNWRHLQQEGMFFEKSLWFRSKHAVRGFKFAGDWSLWREFAQHADYFYVRKPLGAFRRRKGQLSVVNYVDYQKEIERSMPMATRKSVMASLLMRRQEIFGNVISIASSLDAPVLESCSMDELFEHSSTSRF